MMSVFDNRKCSILDYVSAWYERASKFMAKTQIQAAFVSTNSITQGEQVSALWNGLLKRGVTINFAYKTFKWSSEAKERAAVHCVIIGFSYIERTRKKLYNTGTNYEYVNNISPYIMNAQNILVEPRTKPISNVSPMLFGNMANDGGNFILSQEEKEYFESKYPFVKKYIKLFLGAEEFIKNKIRYCLWLKDCSPNELRNMPEILERVENVREIREASSRDATRKLADFPYLFGEIRQPTMNYLMIPRVSSENRKYIPIGYLGPEVIASDRASIIPNATMYEFGILTSNVHNAWMRTVCGRLEMRYNYSVNIVYNNFPWPNPTEEQKAKIEQTAQAILDARALYPDCSLADLYDEVAMPPELRKAHQANDKAVMQSYGFWGKLNSESECVAELMKMYQELTT